MIIRDAFILTMNDRRAAFSGDVAVKDDRIVAVEKKITPQSGEEVIDARGAVLCPGFVQAHVHLCQTLLRNSADDLLLLDWLGRRIWPHEAWLDRAAISAAAYLGILELIDGGTTSILDMGTVRHTDALFEAAAATGIRYVGGKCLMDRNDGDAGPKELFESTDAALAETEELIARWHGRENGRLRYAVSPRFAVTSTEELLRRAGILACRANARLHTHASENVGEVEIVQKRTGRTNVDYLGDMGLLGSQTALAHCIHISEHETNLIWGSGTHVVHCPSSNLKLGSGIAKIPELLEQGINVALGADGAPCNNRLSIFREMHLAATLQKPRLGPKAMPAAQVLEMATMGGARALGLEDEIGSIEPGKKADLLLVDLDRAATFPHADPVSAIVYAADASNVRDVLIDGRFVKRDGKMTGLDAAKIIADAGAAAARWDAFARSRGI